MTGRIEFDGERQRAVLSKLQYRAGLDATEAATRVDFSYPQYLRYARGKTPLRPDQYDLFAVAFGVPVVDLAAELSGVDVYPDLRGIAPADQPEGWTFRDALRGHLPESLIDRYAPIWEGRPLVNQMSAAEAMIEMAAELRSENTPAHLRSSDARAV